MGWMNRIHPQVKSMIVVIIEWIQSAYLIGKQRVESWKDWNKTIEIVDGLKSFKEHKFTVEDISHCELSKSK